MSATAPTQPVAPRPFEPGAPPPAGYAGVPPNAPPADAHRVPWYRRAWVLAVGAVLLALLCFASGFVAGNAASLFDGFGAGPGRGMVQDGRGFPDDGFRPGDGNLPPMPGDSGSRQG